MIVNTVENVLSQTSLKMLPMVKHLFKLGSHDISLVFMYENMYSLHWARKYTQIFVLRSEQFPRAKLKENCKLRGTDNVQGQIYKQIFFKSNGGYCVYYPANIAFLSVAHSTSLVWLQVSLKKWIQIEQEEL